MKTNRNHLETFAFCIALIFSINLYAQKETNSKKVYLRVYNLEGKKISKGHIVFLNDSILGLNKSGKQELIKIGDIGKLKTKRSAGHNVLVGSFVGAGLLALIGGATSEEKTKTGDGGWFFGEYEYTTGTSPGTGAAIGGAIGLIGGAAIGGVASAFKNSKTFIVDGDILKWKTFKEMIEKIRFQ